MASTTHSHLTPMLKKEKSYNFTPTLGIHVLHIVTFTFYLTSVVTLLYIATLKSLKGGVCI